jgi:transcriptional regulator, AraC family
MTIGYRESLGVEVGQTDWKELIGKIRFTTEVAMFKCTSGQAVIVIDSQKHIFRANINFMLKEFTLFQVLEVSDDFCVTYCQFPMKVSNEIYARISSNIYMITDQSVPDIYTEESLVVADSLFGSICHLCQNENHAYHKEMLIHLLLAYTYELYEQTRSFAEKRHASSSITNTDSNILNRFYGLIRKYYTIHRDVKFYASTLNISERYLYKIVKGNIKITPKQMVDDYVIALIKKTLLTTSLSFQQIADRFNFYDQSVMGQFFKRNAGMTLSDFRNKHA